MNTSGTSQNLGFCLDLLSFCAAKLCKLYHVSVWRWLRLLRFIIWSNSEIALESQSDSFCKAQVLRYCSSQRCFVSPGEDDLHFHFDICYFTAPTFCATDHFPSDLWTKEVLDEASQTFVAKRAARLLTRKEQLTQCQWLSRIIIHSIFSKYHTQFPFFGLLFLLNRRNKDGSIPYSKYPWDGWCFDRLVWKCGGLEFNE